tara:strand:- start:2858 stop:3130 length:273 start_codon:yes stop_codon:yes gene_type:complete
MEKNVNEQTLEELHETMLTALEDSVMEMAELQQQQAGTSEHYSGDLADQLFCGRAVMVSTRMLIAAANEMNRRVLMANYRMLRIMWPGGR